MWLELGLGARSAVSEGVLPDGPRASVALVTAAAPVAPRVEVEGSLRTAPTSLDTVMTSLGVPLRTASEQVGVGILADCDFGVRGEDGPWFSPHVVAGWRGAWLSDERLAQGPVLGFAGAVHAGRLGVRAGVQRRWSLDAAARPGTAIGLDLLVGL